MARQKIEHSRFSNTYTSYAGTDILAVFTPKGGSPVAFAELQTISYSIYRPMTQVYTLGRANPSGFVRGQRTIAGSLIFTVFDRHALYTVLQEGYKLQDERCLTLKGDELPPFDININFLNEYGQSASMVIYDVRLMSEGQTMSIEDRITENTMQFIANDIDLMKPGNPANEGVW